MRHALCLLVLAVLSVGCGNKHNVSQISIGRLEQVMMESDDAVLRQQMQQFANTYPTPLIRIYPDDEQYMQLVKGFRDDSVAHIVYDSVQRYYGDLSWLSPQLGEAISRIAVGDSALDYNTLVTYISLDQYDQRVRVDRESRTMAVAIDIYALPYMRRYGYFGMPLYIVHQCGSEHILPDCVAEIVRQHVAWRSDVEPTLLDYMIAEGKVQYALHKALPAVADSTLFRYTAQQMAWMQNNEANVWGYFIQQQLLFERDMSRLRGFISEGPKTNAFQQSAPRTIEYIGWHIVSLYAQRNSSLSLTELLEDTDSQKILQQSGYHP